MHAEHTGGPLLLSFRGICTHLERLHGLQCSTMNDQTHLSIRIDPDLREALKTIAIAEDRPVGYLIRAACLQYVSEYQQARSSVPADHPIPLVATATSPLGVRN